jgi:chromate transporter
VFTTATFIGYVAGHGRVLAALVATIGIFLPSFVFVALLSYILPFVRQSPWARALLDGVNVASLGLMAGVTWQLGQAAVVDLWTAVLAGVALVVVLGVRLNSAWLVLGGGFVGVLLHLLGVG